MKDYQNLTHDDVNKAFEGGAALAEPDERLLGYLGVLCKTQIGSDANRLLANNRCITINTILTRRFVERENKATTRLTWLVVFLAMLSLIGTFIQIGLAIGPR